MQDDLTHETAGREGHGNTAPQEEGGGLHEENPRINTLSGMFEDWFLDYASYVILERAVPHIDDGLKPVQRRILHSMKRMDDGRFNKVANIIGHTMQFHPHGDASIGDALVNMGQKELLVETQGNWGNILTGDGAAAPRYIEARLSKFAHDVVFNPKTTPWKLSYDGRNKEPITLPVKFPLLLQQGVEGIAVGLASKILPHNFLELIDASIAHLRGESFELYPDFPTGGYIDVSRYNEGIRGGSVRIRAKIVKVDSKTLAIKEVPFGKTTSSLIDSILKANDKGKIKIRKIDDNTAAEAEILVHLAPGISPDKTIDALYAFTDCEIPVSPNSCVIDEHQPRFLPVSDILKISTQRTMNLLRQELEIRLGELEEDWHFSSLEKVFFEQKIYRELEKDLASWDEQIDAIDTAFIPFRKLFKREILRDDLLKLTEKPVRRISKFDLKKAEEHIRGVEEEMAQVRHNLAHLTDYAIAYFGSIREKHGKGRERRTEIRNFDNIEAARVVIANEKLYVNREEGMIGTSLKKDEFLCDCSDMDDIIVIRKDGSYVVSKVSEKAFFGKNIHYVNIFKKNDSRTIYNIVYRDGKNGAIMMKRCAISGITRDKEYNITKGTPGTQLLYFSANPNGESEILKVYLKPRPRLKSLVMELDLGQLAIKGRDSQGNILTRHGIHKIMLKEKGSSTLGGQKVWFDKDIHRLNTENRGDLIGEFDTHDKLLVVNGSGRFRTCGYDTSYHFEENLLRLEKFDDGKVYTAIYIDPSGQYYLKRFCFEGIERDTPFIPEEGGQLVCISSHSRPRFEITYGGHHAGRPPEIVDGEEFVGIKGFRAKGKRLSSWEIARVEECEPAEPEINDQPNQDEGPDTLQEEEIEVTSSPAEVEEIADDENPAAEETRETEEIRDPFPDVKMEVIRPGEQMELF